MFKRSLASLAAVAVASGAVVAPANAMTATVNNNETCTITSTVEEAGFVGLKTTVTVPKAKISTFKMYTAGLPSLRAKRAELEKKLANSKPGSEEEEEELTSKLVVETKRITAIENFDKALDACAAGHNYDSEKPNGPKQPDGSEKPNGPKQPDGSEKPNGPKQPDGSEKPNGPKQPDGSEKPNGPKQPDGSEKPNGPKQPDGSKQPDGERALPSTNGAVIGAIVAVLGILAAALPVIKSILRALLP
ncbi:hypothetical protein CIP107580_01973 [Corynebacterium diphtheriae]|nr:hypothetical protein CIP107533_01996 [Corynebacterium diphtheriae]CAB0664213.1 hypothetical protein CIP107580_01973 [Corynebacterium diphtheriae]